MGLGRDLTFRFLSIDAGGSAGFDRMAGKAGMAHSALDKLAVGAVAAGIGVAAASVKMAGDFQQSTNVLVTAAGESVGNLAKVRAGILAIGRETGTSIPTLTDGMYQVEKAGLRGADGLKVLRAAAQGAREEGANLATVSAAMTSVMTSYHLPASRAVAVMNALKTSAGGSKTTMEDFAGSLSTVLPIASAAGVSFAQVGGAIAGLTRHGTSAFEATQELANTIRSLQAPSKIAVKTMQQFGVSSVDVAKNLGKRGVAGTLEYLVDVIGKHMGPSGLVLIDTFKHAQYATADMTTMLRHMTPEARKLTDELLNNTVTLRGYRTEAGKLPADQAIMARQFANLEVQSRGFSDALKSGSPQAATMTSILKQMLGGSVGLNTALQLTGENQAYVNEQTKRTALSMADQSKSVEGWASTQKLFNVQWDKFRVGVQVLMIDLGTKLLPKLTEVGNWFADHKKVVEGFGELIAVGLAAKFAILAGKLAVSPLVGILKLMKGVGVAGPLGGGALGGVLGTVKPIPVFVTNEGFGGGGGGGWKKAAERDAENVAKNPAADVAAGAAAEAAAKKIGLRLALKGMLADLAPPLAVGLTLGAIDNAYVQPKGGAHKKVRSLLDTIYQNQPSYHPGIGAAYDTAARQSGLFTRDKGVDYGAALAFAEKYGTSKEFAKMTALLQSWMSAHRHDNIFNELSYLLKPSGVKGFAQTSFPGGHFDASRASAYLLRQNPSKQEVAYLKDLGHEFPAVALAVQDYQNRLDRATDATDRLKSASAQARGATLAHAAALTAAKVALENVNDSIGHEKSSLALLRAAEISHADAVRVVVGQLKRLPGAYAQAAAQAKRGGLTIGEQLDAGLTIAIPAGAGKVNLVAEQLIDGVLHRVSKRAGIASPSKKTMYIGAMLAEGIIDGFRSVSSRMLHLLPLPVQSLLDDMQRRVRIGIAALNTTVKTAASKLKADTATRNALASSIASGWESYADISGAYDSTLSVPTDLTSFLTGRLNTMRSLDTDLSRLGKMGLSGGLIKQLASMAPDQGLQFATSILGGNGGSVAHLNSLWGQISKATSHASMTAANAVMGRQIAADRRAVARAEHQRDEMIAVLSLIARKVGANPTAAEIRQELLALKRTKLGGAPLGLA